MLLGACTELGSGGNPLGGDGGLDGGRDAQAGDGSPHDDGSAPPLDSGEDDAALDGGRDASEPDGGPIVVPCEAETVRSDAGECLPSGGPCAVDNGGCEQRCEEHDGAAECSCGVGYRLEGNDHGCRPTQWSAMPILLNVASRSRDERLMAFDVAESGAAIAVLQPLEPDALLFSRAYSPSNGWSATVDEVPGSDPATTVGAALLSVDEAVLVWFTQPGISNSFIYSSVWSGTAWTSAARRDVRNYDGAYSPSVSRDSSGRVCAMWQTYDLMIRSHFWVETYGGATDGWLGAAAFEPFEEQAMDAPVSYAGAVLAAAPERCLYVVDRTSAATLDLAYRHEGQAEAVELPGNPQAGTGWSLVGNGRGVAYLVTGDSATCRARRYEVETGFGADTLESASVTKPACPSVVNRDGDGLAAWVDDDSAALVLSRVPASSISASKPAGVWDDPETIAPDEGIGSIAIASSSGVDDRAVLWLTTEAPASLRASVYREGDGWSEPRTLSLDNGEAVTSFRVKMDATGNAAVVFEQRNGEFARVWAMHLR